MVRGDAVTTAGAPEGVRAATGRSGLDTGRHGEGAGGRAQTTGGRRTQTPGGGRREHERER